MSSRASSFGQRAADYDRVRPDYPPEAIDLLVARLGLGAGSVVLDLGAGTGKLTRPLVDRAVRVIAVEPDARMRRVLSRATTCYRVLDGRAEAIPLSDGAVDAVVAGEAFHWFQPELALAEIARVLRPGGGIGLIWKHWWETEPPLPPAAADLARRVYERPNLEPLPNEDWRGSFAGSPFIDLREDNLDHETLTLDGDDLATLILTTSVFGSLPPDEFDRVEVELHRLVTGKYRVPVKSGVYSARLSG
jgi:SAM-dependent methyltransferase